jgi:predicted nucleic acid-binding protein
LTELVLDASVAAKALAEVTPDALALLARLRQSWCSAPHLIDAEVGSVLRRRVAAATLEAETAVGALQAMRRLVHARYPHSPLSQRAWGLRHNLSYYDALYVALATSLGVPLLTADARLACAPALPCAVELVAPTAPTG